MNLEHSMSLDEMRSAMGRANAQPEPAMAIEKPQAWPAALFALLVGSGIIWAIFLIL